VLPPPRARGPGQAIIVAMGDKEAALWNRTR
jgi:hypothetical protein